MHDISIQYYTLEKLGMSVKGASLVYLNSNYVRDNELNLKELFVIEDVTKTVKSFQEVIPTNLQCFNSYLEDKIMNQI